MKPINVVEEEAGDFGAVVRGVTGDEVGALGETIHKDGDSVESARRAWELDNKIHGDRLPALIRDGKRLKKTSGRTIVGLRTLTGVAGRDVALDQSGELRPEEETSDVGVGASETRVSRGRRIVMLGDELGAETRTIRNAETMPILEIKEPRSRVEREAVDNRAPFGRDGFGREIRDD